MKEIKHDVYVSQKEEVYTESKSKQCNWSGWKSIADMEQEILKQKFDTFGNALVHFPALPCKTANCHFYTSVFVLFKQIDRTDIT